MAERGRDRPGPRETPEHPETPRTTPETSEVSEAPQSPDAAAKSEAPEASSGTSEPASTPEPASTSEPAASAQDTHEGARGFFPRRPRSVSFRTLLSPLVVGALAFGLLLGTLLGGPAIRWVGDRVAGDDTYCWDALSEKDVGWFFTGGEFRSDVNQPLSGPVESEETRMDRLAPKAPQHAAQDPGGALCRLTGGYASLIVTVRQLDSDARYGAWGRQHLTTGLEPMVQGLPGMAGSDHAWLKLPTECLATSSKQPPSVVSVTGDVYRRDVSRQELVERYARVAVSVGNAALERHGCEERLPLGESGRLTSGTSGTAAKGEAGTSALCGLDIKSDLPSRVREKYIRGGTPGGPVRVCQSQSDSGQLQFRLVAVNDPTLLDVILPHPRPPGMRVMTVRCEQYEMTFAGEAAERRSGARDEEKVPLSTLLGKFAKQEARHHGCGPVKVKQVPADN